MRNNQKLCVQRAIKTDQSQMSHGKITSKGKIPSVAKEPPPF